MSKKIKRTCRVCGYVWFSSLAGGCLGLIFRNFYAVLLTVISKGSYIDQSKAYDEVSTCPNCNARASYKTEFITVEEEKKVGSEEKKVGCLPVITAIISVVGVIIVIAIIVTSISTCQDKKEEAKNTTESDNASFERAKVLLQNSKYSQEALNELNSISGKYFTPEKYKEFSALKAKLQHRADSLLSEESYALGKKLFEEGKYEDALPALNKIYSKHKEYSEIKNKIAFINEYMEAGEETLILFSYVHGKDDLNVSGASGKEFQSILNAANDKLLVLQGVVIHYGKMAAHIKSCEKFQKSEFKYLKPQERNNLKTEWKKIAIQAKNKLKREQSRDFPVLRKEYAKIISDKLWRDNYIVKSAGTGNSRLEFINGIFANNANIDDFHKTLIDTKAIETINLFRFKRISFKWDEYFSKDKYIYYEYNTPADDVEVNENTMGEIKK